VVAMPRERVEVRQSPAHTGERWVTFQASPAIGECECAKLGKLSQGVESQRRGDRETKAAEVTEGIGLEHGQCQKDAIDKAGQVSVDVNVSQMRHTAQNHENRRLDFVLGIDSHRQSARGKRVTASNEVESHCLQLLSAIDGKAPRNERLDVRLQKQSEEDLLLERKGTNSPLLAEYQQGEEICVILRCKGKNVVNEIRWQTRVIKRRHCAQRPLFACTDFKMLTMGMASF
jgi:hypothetical protein